MTQSKQAVARTAAPQTSKAAPDLTYVAGVPKEPVVPKQVAGVPGQIDHARDLGVHYGFHTDSNFVVSRLRAADGREFQVILHQMAVNPNKLPDSYPILLSIISISDRENRWHAQEEHAFPAGEFHVSPDRLDISCANSAIVGTLDAMKMRSNLPNGTGTIELELQRTGPVLDNCGTGLFPFLSGQVPVWQFALPYMTAKGTLTLDGKTQEISGDAWLDRQWNDMPIDFFEKRTKWKWMNLSLSNGVKISLWDMSVHGKKQNAWATALTPSGAVMMADMVPLAENESEHWTSPVTGQTYATAYKVIIPAFDAEFDVRIWEGMPDQEIISPSGDNKYEAACTFTGQFMGEEVTGFNCVELVGNFLA